MFPSSGGPGFLHVTELTFLPQHKALPVYSVPSFLCSEPFIIPVE